MLNCILISASFKLLQIHAVGDGLRQGDAPAQTELLQKAKPVLILTLCLILTYYLLILLFTPTGCINLKRNFEL